MIFRKSEGGYENGLLLANTPEIYLRDSADIQYYNGFKNSDGRVTTGFISKNGFLLFGQVRLNPQTHQLEVVHDDALAWVLFDKMQLESIYFPFARDIKEIFTLDYLRTAFQETGDKLSIVLQDVSSFIIPTGIQESIIKRSKVLPEILIDKGAGIEMTDSHSITVNHLLEMYVELGQYRRLIKGRETGSSPAFSLLGNLEKLNQRMYISNNKFEYDSSIARSDVELDGIITKLGQMVKSGKITKEQFNALLYRDTSGDPYGKDSYSIKKYLENLRNVLAIWSNNEDPGLGSRDNIDQIIYDVQSLIDKFDPLSIGSDTFSTTRINGKISELERGLILLGIGQQLFGPFTFRLILLRSLWYYTHEGGYKVLPLSLFTERVLDYLQDLNLISSRQRMSTSSNTYIPLTTQKDIWDNHIPSLLFGNSFLLLPIDATDSRLNMFEFGYGPLPFVSGISPLDIDLDLILSPTERLFGRTKDDSISKVIANQFNSFLEIYKSKHQYTDQYLSQVNLDMKSYEDIMTVVEEKIMIHFASKSGDITKNLMDADNVILSARRELTTFSSRYSKDHISLIKGDSIRRQLIDFFDDLSISEKKIIFHGAVVDGETFSLKFTKIDFAGKFALMNGNTNWERWGAFNLNYIEQYNKKIIDNRVDVLTGLIMSQPEGYKKVRIFIGQNLGVSQDLATIFGYQYIEATTSAQEWIPRTDSMKTRVKSPSYIDIDLSGGLTYSGRIKLRYLVLLSLASEQRAKTGWSSAVQVGKNFRDFIFIIKHADSTIDDQNYIAYFNHEYIRSSDRLTPYSNDISGSMDTTYGGYKRIDLVSPYDRSEMYWSNRFSSDWAKVDSFIPFWPVSRPRGVIISQFMYYFDYMDYINNLIHIL